MSAKSDKIFFIKKKKKKKKSGLRIFIFTHSTPSYKLYNKSECKIETMRWRTIVTKVKYEN